MDLRLDGQAAIVTGAASGIGEATAAALAAEGAGVALVDRDGPGLATAEKQLRGTGAEVVTIIADLGTADGAAEAIRAGLAAFGGRASILVNSAGTCQFRPFAELGYTDWQRTLQVNLLAAMEACRAVVPAMQAAGGGVIANVGSDLARHPLPAAPDYSASKAALLAFSASLAQELAPQIRVVAVSPGPIWTPLWSRPGGLAESIAARRGLPPEKAAQAEIRERGILAGRLGTADEVARVITFLVSPAASYVNCANIAVDGGSCPATF
jgi:NAD(P)-dependent dehydrogenase (short-subunit alcohol dehydrogenase family)